MFNHPKPVNRASRELCASRQQSRILGDPFRTFRDSSATGESPPFDGNLRRVREPGTRHVLSANPCVTLRASRRISRVLAARHRFRLRLRDVFPAAVLPAVWNAASPHVGARNEFNSTALRNWLRSHSSDKFLIVCPAPPGELARSRHGDDRRSPPAG